MMAEEAGGCISGELYRDLQPRLAGILAANLQPPEWVIDDACQTAWSSLIEHRGSVIPGSELGWLATTATRAALRLLRREPLTSRQPLPAPVALADFRAPERHLEVRERLAEIRRLPLRQQRVVLLHGFGYEYGEIAAVTGESRRTVARQLTRARQRLLRPAGEGW